MSTSLLLLKLPGVTGDCSVAGFEGQISLDSFDWDLKVDARNSSGSKDQKPTVALACGSLQVAKYYDSSSIQMCNLMDKDQLFKEGVVLRFVDPTTSGVGSNPHFETIMKMEMREVYIENISIKASESKNSISLKEDITLSFQQVDIIYYYFEPTKNSRIAASTFEWKAPDR